MIEKARKFLAAPVFEDTKTNFVAQNLNVILLATLTGTIFTLFQYFIFGETRPTLLVGGIASAISLYMLHRGWVKMASYLGLVALSSVPFLLIIHSGGIHDTAIMLLPVLIIVASMLLSWRGLVIYVVAIAILVGAVIHAEINGILAITYNNAPTTYSDAVDVLTMLAIAALMSGLLAISLRRNLRSLEKTLKELEASKEKYRLISNLSTDYVFSSTVDSNGVIINNWESGAFELIHGYSHEEFLALGGWRSVVYPDDINIDDQGLEKLHANQKTVDELRVITKTGQIRWVRVYASPAWDEQENRLTGIYGAVQNIDEQKRAEKILRQRDAILEVVAHSAQIFLQSSNWRESIKNVLEELGKATGASHVYIFENHVLPDGSEVTSQRYEWAIPNIKTDLNAPQYQNLPLLEEGTDGWIYLLSNGKPYFGNLDTFSDQESRHFREIGVKSILDVPIFVRGKWWGEIGFDDMENVRTWDQSEIETLQVAAKMIGSAIEREQVDEALRQKASQMSALYEIGLAVTSNLDLDQILDDLFEKCKQLLPIDTFYIAIYDETTDLIKHPLFYDGNTRTRIRVDDRDIQTVPGLSGHVILGRKTLYLPDSADPAILEEYQIVPTGSTPSRSYVGVPMFLHERVVGVISMQKFETNAYSSEQIQFLETIATQAAAAIENARLYRETETRLKTLDLLHQVSQEITSTLELERVLTTTTLAVKDLLGGFSSSIFTVDGADLVFDVTSGEMEADIKSFRFPLNQGITGWIVTNKQPVIINDIPNDPRYLDTLDKKAGITVQNMLAVPLLVNDRCIGVLNVINKPGGFSRADLKLLEMFAVNVGFAIENARLYESAQQELLERKKTQAELEASNRELESLSYNIAHDMRSPVRAMVGYATMLQQSQGHKLDADGQVELDKITAAAKRLGVLIDGFLEYLRLGSRAIHKQPVQVEKLVNSINARLLARNPDRQIQVSIARLPECPADPALLEQVWMHLLTNAVKFTRPRATALIEIGSGEKDNQTYYFVRDNGIGFDMQYAGKIFILFQHLNSQDEYEGNGIGLAIVQRIIQRHGGRVWAESVVDQGATFYFTV